MKKCPKCGIELADDAMFCNECGTKFEAPKAEAPADAPANNSVLSQAQETAKNNNIGVIAVAAVAVIAVVVLLCVLLGGNPAKAPINKYMKAFQKGDAKTMAYLMLPKSSLDDFLDDVYDCDTDEFIDANTEAMNIMWDAFKDEGKIEFTYEIKNSENIKKLKKLKSDAKKMGIKDLDDFQDLVDDMYDDYDIDADKIKDVYLAEVKWELKVDKDKIAKGTSYIFAFKYKGSWYLGGSLIDGSDIINSIMDDRDLRDDYEDMLEDISDLYDDYPEALTQYYYVTWYY